MFSTAKWFKHYGVPKERFVKYNDIMSKFGDYLVSYCSKMFSIQTIEKHRKFYLNFKKDVSKKKVLINEM